MSSGVSPPSPPSPLSSPLSGPGQYGGPYSGPTRVGAPVALGRSEGDSPRRAIETLSQVIVRPTLHCRLTAGAEAANTRRLTVQVVDRQDVARPGRYRVRVVVATSAYGAPAAGLTMTLVTGTAAHTYTANRDQEYITDEFGKIEIDLVAGAGASTWHTHASAVELDQSGVIAFT